MTRLRDGDTCELRTLLEAKHRAYGDPAIRAYFERAIDRSMVAFLVADHARRSVS